MDAGGTTYPPPCDMFWSEAAASHMKVESILVVFDAFCEHPRHSAAERVCPLALLPYETADQRRLLLENKKCQGEAISDGGASTFSHVLCLQWAVITQPLVCDTYPCVHVYLGCGLDHHVNSMRLE